MHTRFSHGGVAILMGCLSWISSATAQVPLSHSPADSTAALQQQIDELKQGQALILEELRQLKQLIAVQAEHKDGLAKSAQPKVVSINVHGEPFRGDSQAHVGIMEFSDFECSFCGRYVQQIYPLIDREFIKTGKVRYFFRDFPDAVDTNAWNKAQAARCAGEQGKFWEMHDLLFATQTDPLERSMTEHAETLGLDGQKLSACLASGRYRQSIRLSVAGGRQIGIQGTPAFVIGTMSDDGDFLRSTNIVLGAQSFESFKETLDTLIDAANNDQSR